MYVRVYICPFNGNKCVTNTLKLKKIFPPRKLPCLFINSIMIWNSLLVFLLPIIGNFNKNGNIATIMLINGVINLLYE